MNRFPHDSHSPTSIPSSPVENRRVAPHFRHGRPRGASASNLSGRSRSRSNFGASRWGTKTVVISQSAQIASSVPFWPSRNARGAPHSSHSGPPSAPAVRTAPASEPGAPSDGPGVSREETVVPSTKANSFEQDGQVPVRRCTSRSSNSIEVPQSGQELLMVGPRRKEPAPSLHPPAVSRGRIPRRRLVRSSAPRVRGSASRPDGRSLRRSPVLRCG